MVLDSILQLTPDDRELRIKQIEEKIESLEIIKSELLQELLEIDQL